MDPITHSLTGGLVGHSLNSNRKRVLIFCFLGEAPDLDVFLAPLGPWAFIFQHRGISHSFFGIFIQAIVYAWVFKRWDSSQDESFAYRSGLYTLPLLVHIFCDYLTSYGIPLFSPFSLKNYQADIATAVNFIPMLLMAVGFWGMRRWPIWKKTINKMLWIVWGIYIAGSMLLKKIVSLHYTDGTSTIVATLFDPFDWSIVDDKTEALSYACTHVNLFKNNPVKISVPKPPNLDVVTVSRETPLVQDFLKENRWPSVRIVSIPSGWQVDWGSLLFSRRGMVRGKVRVIIDNNGHVIDSHRFFGFWNPEI